MLRPSLLQGERGNIVIISGTDVSHCNQSLLFEGPLLGFFFSVVMYPICSFHFGAYTTVLGFSR